MKSKRGIHKGAALPHHDGAVCSFALPAEFPVAELRWLSARRDAWVEKGHYHEGLDQLFCIARGFASIDVVDTTDGAARLEKINLTEGDLLLVPAGCAHRAHALAGSILIIANTRPRVPGKGHDIPFDFRTFAVAQEADGQSSTMRSRVAPAGSGLSTGAEDASGLASGPGPALASHATENST
jgi:uncharacterized protein YjlB